CVAVLVAIQPRDRWFESSSHNSFPAERGWSCTTHTRVPGTTRRQRDSWLLRTRSCTDQAFSRRTASRSARQYANTCRAARVQDTGGLSVSSAHPRGFEPLTFGSVDRCVHELN